MYVGSAKSGPQGGFLVPHHEQMGNEYEGDTVQKERHRLIERCRPDQREGRANVHRVADQPIRADHDEASRRIEWRRRSTAAYNESDDAPQREDRSARANNRAGNLRGADAARTDDPGPGKNAGRQEHQ